MDNKLRGKLEAGEDTVAIQKQLLEQGFIWSGLNPSASVPEAYYLYLEDGKLSMSEEDEEDFFDNYNGSPLLEFRKDITVVYEFTEVVESPPTVLLKHGEYSKAGLQEIIDRL